MAEGFARAVDDGLKLTKRLYFGKDPTAMVAPPKPTATMDRSSAAGERATFHTLLPTAPMAYAVVSDPAIVDNPDIPSYQPHVHGRCDPPALIPLAMHASELDLDCFADTALVRVSCSWRVHCVMGSRSCACLVAVPIGEQGSILGVEIEVSNKSYRTKLVKADDDKDLEKAKSADGGFLTSNIFTLTVPQVDGGTIFSVKISWSQKLVYKDGQYTLNIPYSFPEYVTPSVKKISKKEKIQLSVNVGTGGEVLCKAISHPLKEVRRQAGKLGFFYQAEVYHWSTTDFNFSYAISSNDIHGAVFLQSPPAHSFDQREMFCIYLYPGSKKRTEVFRKDIVFVVDISGSMRGKPLDDTKNVLSAALAKLEPEDSFSIIAFNGETYLFSTSLELATKDAIERAIEWMNVNFIAGGDTNILVPLIKAIELLSKARGLTPTIFFVTDGAVEDERRICNVVKDHFKDRGPRCPRIHTFGIGTFCNHYFLRMLAAISHGYYSAAYDVDLVEDRLEKLLTKASSVILSSISFNFDAVDKLSDLEVFPSRIPDLVSDAPLVISGRCRGNFPDSLKAKGMLANSNDLVINLKVHNTKDIPLDRINAKDQIELLTSQAWFSDDKDLEDKIAKFSIQTGIVSEYTRMIVLETIQKKVPNLLQEVPKKGQPAQKIVEFEAPKETPLQSLCVGFGSWTATAENFPPGREAPRLPEAAEMFVRAASSCCGSVFRHCCCMCCVQFCSNMNNQCAIVLTQICTGLAIFGCFECCMSLCCANSDGR